jgi:type I restriction enzyme M protein
LAQLTTLAEEESQIDSRLKGYLAELGLVEAEE